MQREVIKHESTEQWLQNRSQDITSTEAGALFGISPYQTKFELWHQHRDNKIISIDENERMVWGKVLQDPIALHVAKGMGVDARRLDDYIRIPELRIGSSFDFEIPERNEILEVKNVDALMFRDGWIVEGAEIEAPPHIELQLQHQMLVKGAEVGYIAALIGGNRVVLLRREADSTVHERIQDEAFQFWKSIDEGVAPEPDFTRDADFISKLYRQSNADLVVSADQQIEYLAREYADASAHEKAAKQRKDAAKAEILMSIGEAGKVIGSDFSISAGTTKESFIEAHTRAGFRNFRVNFKKVKS